jgi:S-adenosylmethionine:tRNA ribosyltransferase-isomerase
MNTQDLDFDLPKALIAQSPMPDRAASRLLHYRRDDKSIAHRRFAELPTLLHPGDLLVFNDTRVLPARFALRKPAGGMVEGLFLQEPQPGQWRVMLKNVGSVTPQPFTFDRDPTLTAQIIEKHDAGEYTIAIRPTEAAPFILSRLGRMPLPPYIHREKNHDPRDQDDRQRYQTVYATTPGAIAAPTAGLHFTPQILSHLDDLGIQRAFITLHVGLGTFKPITADHLEDHPMHSEWYSINGDAAAALNRAKSGKRRIIPIGTTSARVLETQPADLPLKPHSAQTKIFIYPPYQWKHASALLTNFHLPKSTLIALVAAMIGLEEQRRVYTQAIQEKYRFFSYGDAMLIE